MLQSIFGFNDQPQYLDASDALAVAYSCYMEQTDPLAGLRDQLKPKRVHKSKKQMWGDYVNANLDRIES